MTRSHRCKSYSFALALTLGLWSANAVPAPAGTAAKSTAKTALSQRDQTILLSGCGGQALRNAKLYAARVKDVQIMKQSAERNQARSTASLEDQMNLLLDILRHNSNLKAEATRMEDALVLMTELTVQAPLADQVSSALRLAEMAARSCSALRVGGGYTADAAATRWIAMLEDSQRIAAMALENASTPSAAANNAKPLQEAVLRFDGALAALKKEAATLNQESTVKAIDDQWFFARTALAKANKGHQGSVENIARTSELLFDILSTALRASIK